MRPPSPLVADPYVSYGPRLRAGGPASMLFADVSGYTRLTERLAVQGRGGAEIVTQVVNGCFTELIDEVFAADGDVVRFGGDALFVVFAGDDRVEQAAGAAARMQAAIGRLPAVEVPGGRVRLRISIGLHDGALGVHEWSGSWCERLPVGAAVSETLRLEAAADAGQVRVSQVVAAALGPRLVADGLLRLAAASRLAGRRSPELPGGGGGSADALPAALRSVLAHEVAPEHRPVSIAFVSLPGTDGPPSRRGPALDRLLAAIDGVSGRYGVLPVSTDVAPDGIKVILATGVPTATEDDETRLLLAAREVVAACRRARAGVHSGIVFCGDVGHPRRRTFTIMGDAVNLTARLMGKADAGEVLASRSFVDALRMPHELRWREPFAVKGKLAPQHAATVGRALPAGSAASELPFRGRRDEVQSLVARLREPGLVELIGPPGIGTTRLAVEAIRRSRREAVVATATVADRGVALGAARRAVGVLGGIVELPSVGDAAAAIDALVVTLARLCGAAGAPVLVFEASQHLDEATQAVLRGLDVAVRETGGRDAGGRDAGGRVMVCGRTAIVDPDAAVAIGPLAAEDLRDVAVDASLRPLSDAELEEIVGRAAGNPRFTQELARLDRTDAELPSSVEALVAARLDALAPADRRIVREAALVGAVVDLGLLAAVTDRSIAVLHAVLASSELVTVDRSTATFADETVREVALAGLPMRERRPLHQHAAEILEACGGAPASIAYHAAQAGDDERCVQWAERAALEALARGATAAAGRQARLALDAAERLTRPGAERARLARLLGEATMAAGLPAQADAAFLKAIRCEPEAAQRAELYMLRGRLARRQGRGRASAVALGKALALAEGSRRSLVEVEQGYLDFECGRLVRAQRIGSRVAAGALSSGDYGLAARALSLVEMADSVSGEAGVGEVGRAALDAARRSGDPDLWAVAANNAAITLDNRGRWPEALELYAEAETKFVESGNAAERARLLRNAATIAIELGDVDRASRVLDGVMRVAAAAADDEAQAAVAVMQLRCDVRAGRVRGAAERVAQVRAGLSGILDPEVAAFQQAGLVEVLLLLGAGAEALELANRIADSTAHLDTDHLLPVTLRRQRAVCLWYLGRSAEAEREIRTAVELADRYGLAPEQCFARWVAQRLGVVVDAGDDTLRDLERRVGAVAAPRYQRPTRLPPGPDCTTA